MDHARRSTLRTLLYGPGLVGLRSLVTGLPASLLLAADAARPDKFAKAATTAAAASSKAQFTIFCTSAYGDPLNANVPGTFSDPNIVRSASDIMQQTSFSMGGTQVVGAKCWADLGADMLAQTSFFHHATYTVVHPDEGKVLTVQGNVREGEILPSFLSKRLAGDLNTIRTQPINFMTPDHGPVTCDGVLQPNLNPGSLATMLASPDGHLGEANLVALRDKTLDSLNKWIKAQGAAYQGKVIDDYALSQNQVRTMQGSVVQQLASINGNDATAQMQAAMVLFQMKVTPVVVMYLPFGSDNHFADIRGTVDFYNSELRDHRASTALLAQLPQMAKTAGLDGKVSLCVLNVFGRTLLDPNGRDHNGKHAVSLMIGSNVRGGVVGGMALPSMADPAHHQARAIDSATGLANDSGDITYEDTLASYAKTLTVACGLSTTVADEAFRSGKIVTGAIAS